MRCTSLQRLRYAIVFHVMRQNWPTGTHVEYDLWAIELVVGGELRTHECMLWAKWWPVFTTDYGCGLSWRNKLHVCEPLVLVVSLSVLLCAYFCWRYLSHRFSFLSSFAHAFARAPQQTHLLPLCFVAGRFECILIHFNLFSIKNLSTIYARMGWGTTTCDILENLCGCARAARMKKQSPVAHWIKRANRRYAVSLNINCICHSGQWMRMNRCCWCCCRENYCCESVK